MRCGYPAASIRIAEYATTVLHFQTLIEQGLLQLLPSS